MNPGEPDSKHIMQPRNITPPPSLDSLRQLQRDITYVVSMLEILGTDLLTYAGNTAAEVDRYIEAMGEEIMDPSPLTAKTHPLTRKLLLEIEQLSTRVREEMSQADKPELECSPYHLVCDCANLPFMEFLRIKEELNKTLFETELSVISAHHPNMDEETITATIALKPIMKLSTMQWWESWGGRDLNP